MAGTVYILLALTAILTISNTSAESQDVGVTKEELDKVSEELSERPEKLFKFYKELADLLKLIENKPKSVKAYLKAMDYIESEAPYLQNTKGFWKHVLHKTFEDQLKILHEKTTTKKITKEEEDMVNEEGDKLEKELLTHPKELLQFLQYMSVFLNEIEHKPKVLKDFLEKLDVLLKGAHELEEAQKKFLKKVLGILFGDEYTTTASRSTKKPATRRRFDHGVSDGRGLLASLPLNMVA